MSGPERAWGHSREPADEPLGRVALLRDAGVRAVTTVEQGVSRAGHTLSDGAARVRDTVAAQAADLREAVRREDGPVSGRGWMQAAGAERVADAPAAPTMLVRLTRAVRGTMRRAAHLVAERPIVAIGAGVTIGAGTAMLPVSRRERAVWAAITAAAGTRRATARAGRTATRASRLAAATTAALGRVAGATTGVRQGVVSRGRRFGTKVASL